ncbi:hypothetical protein NC651_027480 [Populus alba x Populus x berolinensis]|nr:hypothetical protein NC651_027480 [Populus alba x Populus x berolinensis]
MESLFFVEGISKPLCQRAMRDNFFINESKIGVTCSNKQKWVLNRRLKPRAVRRASEKIATPLTLYRVRTFTNTPLPSNLSLLVDELFSTLYITLYFYIYSMQDMFINN